MAQAARSTDIDIDWLLEYLSGEWRNVVCAASAWDSWDQETRLDYLNEWPITESYGEVLRDAVSRGQLNAAQTRRYQELLALIDAARPTVDDLLERGEHEPGRERDHPITDHG